MTPVHSIAPYAIVVDLRSSKLSLERQAERVHVEANRFFFGNPEAWRAEMARGKQTRIPVPSRELARMALDSGALVRIHRLLDGRQWSADTLDAIADVVRSTGRVIREPKESARIRDLSIFPDRRRG